MQSTNAINCLSTKFPKKNYCQSNDNFKTFLFLASTGKFMFRNVEAIYMLPVVQENDYPPDL